MLGAELFHRSVGIRIGDLNVTTRDIMGDIARKAKGGDMESKGSSEQGRTTPTHEMSAGWYIPNGWSLISMDLDEREEKALQALFRDNPNFLLDILESDDALRSSSDVASEALRLSSDVASERIKNAGDNAD